MEVDAEYYTLSASGLVHVRPGAQSEFTPLGDWVREKSIFSMLTRMKFFKHYLVNKVFKGWHKGVRQKLFNQVRVPSQGPVTGLPYPGERRFLLSVLGDPLAPEPHVLDLLGAQRSGAPGCVAWQVRARLSRRLFLAKPTFCASLMEIYGYVSDTNEVQLMVANQNTLYHLEDFAELQVRGLRPTPSWLCSFHIAIPGGV